MSLNLFTLIVFAIGSAGPSWTLESVTDLSIFISEIEPKNVILSLLNYQPHVVS